MLKPLFEHLWRGLEQPKASIYVGSIGGVCQHSCTALAYEGSPRTDVVEVLVVKIMCLRSRTPVPASSRAAPIASA
jgi:hypothetical protein